MKKRQILAAAAASALCLGLCGCSTVGENTNQYFSAMSTRFSNWGNKMPASDASAASDSEEEDDTGRLAVPANFSVDADGNYTFDGVENADHYIIYIYDKDSDSEEYLYVSDSIPNEEGTGTYSGSLKDYFSYGYGNFDVEVVAYPTLTDKENKQSRAAKCDYLVSGEVTAPQYAYFWDYFSGTFNVELINIMDYEFTAIPETVTFTLSGGGQDYTFTLENASIEGDGVYTASIADVAADATYTLTADAVWNENIVSNPTDSTEIGTVEIASDKNAISDGYGYLNNSIYTTLDYPAVAADFSLTDGGDAGIWYELGLPSSKGYGPLNVGSVSELTFGTSDAHYVATPTAANAGAAYSYSIVVTKSEGTIIGSWEGEAESMTGTLDLNADGTFTMELDYLLIGINPMSKANQELPGSSIQGSWVENGDGTATLSYDHSTAVATE